MTAATAPGRVRQAVRRNSKHAGGAEIELWRRHNTFPRAEHNARMRAAEDFEHATKLPGKRNGALGAIGLKVYRFMLRLRGRKTGQLDPTYQWIADQVHHSRSAVAEALQRLKAHGFLDWIRRCEPIVDAEPDGQQVEQVSNAYFFGLPATAAGQVRRMLGRPSEFVRAVAERLARARIVATASPEEIVAEIKDRELRLVSLRLTEKRGGDADELEIVVDDADGAMALPSTGAAVELRLGWAAGSAVDVGLVDKGRFVVSGISHGGPPDVVTVTARSADMTSAIRTRRDQSWHDTTLGAIVEEVAGRHALTARCAPALAGIEVDAFGQSRESDMALVRRLGREHDAVATVKAGALILAPIGAATTATGAAIPGLAIARGAGDRHVFTVEKRDEAGAVEAQWHDRKGARKRTVSVGGGQGTTRRLARTYASEAAANRAATAEQRRAARAPVKLDITLALGRLDVYPDRPVTVSGFKSAIDAVKWLVTDVAHDLTPDRGFTTQVTLESA